MRAAAPDVVLVILDALVEQALDRFDAVLGDPALEILFDDADVAAKRDAWETARWARHLQAKLHGHDDVLPRARDAARGRCSRRQRRTARFPGGDGSIEPAGRGDARRAAGAVRRHRRRRAARW